MLNSKENVFLLVCRFKQVAVEFNIHYNELGFLMLHLLDCIFGAEVAKKF